MSVKVFEVGSLDELVDMLHTVEQEMGGSKEDAHADAAHDPEECPWCQLEVVSEKLDASDMRYLHTLALLWALLDKIGPVVMTHAELKPPHKLLSIDAQPIDGGYQFKACSEQVN